MIRAPAVVALSLVFAVAGCNSMGAPGAAEVRSSIEKANFVVTIDGGELEVVRVEGRIDRLIADAVAEDPREAAELLAGLTGS